ncbi:hypothetical protein ASG28_12275 [Frigoribacterium sp. Leaf415]|nr:hypothetical protein ASF07_12265 [Frigoribacterium sp. Leaf254]KQT40220.1 hypothetical protein ASG28_12275 [Frigoribacterium sp. Leaf415]
MGELLLVSVAQPVERHENRVLISQEVDVFSQVALVVRRSEEHVPFGFLPRPLEHEVRGVCVVEVSSFVHTYVGVHLREGLDDLLLHGIDGRSRVKC